MRLAPTALQKLQELESTSSSPVTNAEIRRLLESGSDLDLYKVNPYRLAREIGVPVEDVLRTLLFATRLGIFDLNYDTYCPECRGNTEYAKHLMGVSMASHCNLCRIDFDIEYLEQVEVTFTVNAGVRAIEVVDFSDRPIPQRAQWFEDVAVRNGRKAEFKALFEQPGSTQDIRCELAAGTYEAYVPRARDKAGTIVVAGEPTDELQRVALTVREDGRIEPARLAVRPGPVAIAATSHYPVAMWPILGRAVGEPAMWLSAAFVTSQQDFRDLFGGEFLAPGVTFGVRSATLMFTDIRSSTEMFEELGDSPAYALVHEHFDVMSRIIRAHRGGIVKTIGDAVMAAFTSNADGVAAAIAIQRAFHAEAIRGRRVELKIGLHRGPTIAVTSNRALDYFGRTVNMAARVQSTSRPGEVLLSDEVAADPAVAPILASGVRVDVVEAALKGIGEGFRLHRVRVA